MVAPLNANTRNPRVVCMAVRVDPFARLRDGSLAAKPSALLPWADPYIAGLVRRLQSEVRFERADAADPRNPRANAALSPVAKGVSAMRGFATSPSADLEPPSPAVDAEWEGWDQPRWPDGEAQ